MALIVIELDINWPIGALGSAALIWVFAEQKLWAQVGLQIFYVVECLFGWWKWTRREVGTGVKLVQIGRTKAVTATWLAGITVMGTAAMYAVFRLTGDPAPFWDSVIAVTSVVAEYMLCVKLYEAWGAYLASDIAALILLAWLGMWVTFGTYLAFTFLCVLGTLEWLRRLRKRPSGRESSGESSTLSTAATSG